MKLIDLLKVCNGGNIRLYSSATGHIVASKRKNLYKFSDVYIVSIFQRIESPKYGDTARPCLCVYGDAIDIAEAKERRNG